MEYDILQCTMTTTELSKKIEHIVEQKVEQKLLEFLGDPDEDLELKRSFLIKLKKRMKEKQKYTPLSVVARKYGLN